MTKILLITAIVVLPMVLVNILVQCRREDKKQAKLSKLWETGATRLLGKVWGLSNNPDKAGPKIGEPAHVTRKKIAEHIKLADRAGTSFEQEVCGELVKVVLKRPNILFGFVDKPETLEAIQDAHEMMTSPDQQLFVGTCPLELDIRVTQ